MHQIVTCLFLCIESLIENNTWRNSRLTTRIGDYRGVENIRILQTKSKLESKRNILENNIKENIESVEIFSNIG